MSATSLPDNLISSSLVVEIKKLLKTLDEEEKKCFISRITKGYTETSGQKIKYWKTPTGCAFQPLEDVLAHKRSGCFVNETTFNLEFTEMQSADKFLSALTIVDPKNWTGRFVYFLQHKLLSKEIKKWQDYPGRRPSRKGLLWMH